MTQNVSYTIITTHQRLSDSLRSELLGPTWALGSSTENNIKYKIILFYFSYHIKSIILIIVIHTYYFIT